MTDNAHPKTQLRLGIFIVLVTSLVQGVILFNNAAYTLEAFGTAFLAIYLAVATCYITLPWFAEYIQDFVHMRFARAALFAFCLWITFEEHVHAASKFHPPEGLTAAASVFFSQETSKTIATAAVVLFLLAIVEVMTELHHHGAKHVCDAHKRLKSSD